MGGWIGFGVVEITEDGAEGKVVGEDEKLVDSVVVVDDRTGID